MREKEKYANDIWHSGFGRYLTKQPWRTVKRRDAATVLVAFFLILFLGALVFVGWFDAVSSIKPFFSFLFKKQKTKSYEALTIYAKPFR